MVKKRVLDTSKIPMPGEGKRGEQGYLAYLLRQANAAVRVSFDRALANLDVTLPQFSALQMICAYGELSSAELARLTYLTPQTMNIIVKNLETRGAIERAPHSEHGRIIWLKATAVGRRLLSQCRTRVDLIEAKLQTCAEIPAQENAVRHFLALVAKTFDPGADADRR